MGKGSIIHMARRRNRHQKAEENRESILDTIHVIHADDIPAAFTGQALWYTKELWYRTRERYSELVDSRASIKENLEETVQAWHELVALTSILKRNFEWNFILKEPKQTSAFY